MPTCRWFFDVRKQGKEIVIRDGREITSTCGVLYGPVRIISSGKEHTRGYAAKQQALLVSFFNLDIHECI